MVRPAKTGKTSEMLVLQYNHLTCSVRVVRRLIEGKTRASARREFEDSCSAQKAQGGEINEILASDKKLRGVNPHMRRPAPKPRKYESAGTRGCGRSGKKLLK